MVDDKPQADHEPHREQDGQSNMVTRDELNQIVNSAISNRLKSFERKMEEFMKASQPQEVSSGEDDVKFNKKEFMTLKKELDSLKAERDQDRQKLRTTKLDSALQEHLTNLGIHPGMLKHAKASLLHNELISYDEYDNIVFKNGSDELPISQGLGAWVKQEGKAFLPPTGAKGSGDNSYSTSETQKNKQKLTNDEIASLLGS